MSANEFRVIDHIKVGGLSGTLETESSQGSEAYDDCDDGKPLAKQVSVSFLGSSASASTPENLLRRLVDLGVPVLDLASSNPTAIAEMFNFLGTNRRMVTDCGLFRSMSTELGDNLESLLPAVHDATLIWFTLSALPGTSPVERNVMTLDPNHAPR